MRENEEKDLRLELQCNSIAVSEIADDDDSWDGEGVISIDRDEIAEMTSGDEKPFFVQFVALYEGLSGSNRYYTDEAVVSCADAMVGVNMYKGHVEPGTQTWKYREPVGRVVASRVDKMDVDGRKGVLCAKGKAYITEADQKLRTDIRKRMAGNVSILGNARSVRALGESTKRVTKIHKPLDSVDFCNPGTGGMPHAGVTAVVAEMKGEEIDVVVQETKEKEEHMTRLTKEELLAEYKPEISALVGEQIEEQVREIATGRREVAEQREQLKDKQKEFDDTIAEMTAKNTDLQKENDQLKKQLDEERNARIGAEVKSFAEEHISEMKNLDGANIKLIDLAAKRTPVNVVDGDLEKSKNAFRESFKKELEEIGTIAETFGGSGGGGGDDPAPTRNHSRNPGKKGGTDISKVLSPELAEAHNKRIGAAS